MKDIASRVGVRKPSLYNYYSSKDELFLDLLDRSLKAWSEAGISALMDAGPLEERLQRHLKTAVAFANSHPHAVAICRLAVSQISGDLAPRVAKRLEAERTDYQTELAKLMQKAVDRGEIAPPIEEKALAWSAFFDGILFNLVFEHAGSSAYRDHLDALWRVFWNGLAIRKGES